MFKLEFKLLDSITRYGHIENGRYHMTRVNQSASPYRVAADLTAVSHDRHLPISLPIKIAADLTAVSHDQY